jgi:hypothetical protein
MNQKPTRVHHMDSMAHTCAQTAWTPGTALRTHLTATTRKHKGSGAHRGRTTPQVGRTDLVAANPLLPCGVSWLALESIPRVLVGVLTPVFRPINRSGWGLE